LERTPGFVVGVLAVGGGAHGRLFATGTETASSIGSGNNGIWGSDDDGATWRRLYDAGPCLEGNSGCEQVGLVAHPRVPGLIFVPTVRFLLVGPYGSLFRSVDGGESWRTVPDAAQVASTVFAVNAGNPAVYYAATPSFDGAYPGEMFRTEDGGSTWIGISLVDGLSASMLAIDPTDPLTAYAGASDSDGLFRTSDGGVTWTSTDLPSPRGVTVDPTLPGVVFAWGLDHVWRSSDHGATWVELPPIDSPIHDLAASGGRIYAATDSGVVVFQDPRVIPAAEVPSPEPSVFRQIRP
jgi:hypothetical protein